jgi:hypothetical protein
LGHDRSRSSDRRAGRPRPAHTAGTALLAWPGVRVARAQLSRERPGQRRRRGRPAVSCGAGWHNRARQGSSSADGQSPPWRCVAQVLQSAARRSGAGQRVGRLPRDRPSGPDPSERSSRLAICCPTAGHSSRRGRAQDAQRPGVASTPGRAVRWHFRTSEPGTLVQPKMLGSSRWSVPSYFERSSLIPTNRNTCPPGAWK